LSKFEAIVHNEFTDCLQVWIKLFLHHVKFPIYLNQLLLDVLYSNNRLLLRGKLIFQNIGFPAAFP
jgi:hypothetical protein